MKRDWERTKTSELRLLGGVTLTNAAERERHERLSSYRRDRYCPKCQAPTIARRPKTEHGGLHGHATLTALTMGVWAPVWAAAAGGNALRAKHCIACGTPTVPLSQAPPSSAEMEAAEQGRRPPPPLPTTRRAPTVLSRCAPRPAFAASADTNSRLGQRGLLRHHRDALVVTTGCRADSRMQPEASNSS